jgi:hypothetical protein
MNMSTFTINYEDADAMVVAAERDGHGDIETFARSARDFLHSAQSVVRVEMPVEMAFAGGRFNMPAMVHRGHWLFGDGDCQCGSGQNPDTCTVCSSEREPDIDDYTPPDVGPPGSGAVIIEYYGDEPGLEDEPFGMVELQERSWDSHTYGE